MADKLQRSVSSSEGDGSFALALGKIEQYKILESLYQKVSEEKRNLEKELSDLQKTRKEDSRGAPSETESLVKEAVSITQQILDASTIQPLEHPTEFYQVMEKEKNQEIEVLRKKTEDSKRDLKHVQHERDELRGQIQQLMNAMTEKDGCMKELEQRFQETLSEEERRNRLEREQILRDQVHKGASSSWVFVDPFKTHWEKLQLEKLPIAKHDDATLSTAELRRKIDELQRRITELLNHNEKWNMLCQGLQEELDLVKSQLLQYQKAEGLATDSKLEMLRKDAEEMSLKARKQVEELEAKVAHLEKQLEDKERQMFTMAEELRETAMVYQEQIQSYKEDFENEQRDHNITRNQLDSLKTQWIMSYRSLQEKTQQLLAMSQRMEVLEHNNEGLQRQLAQASRDAQLIRDHQKQQQQRTSIPSTDDWRTWECQRCTYRNQEHANVCKMCAASRHHVLLNEPSASHGHASNTTVARVICDTRPFGAAPGFGELEEDGISCY